MPPRCTTRITNLDGATTITEIEELLTSNSKGISIQSGQARISLATTFEGSKVATVTFKDEESSNRAMRLSPQNRVLHDKQIALDTVFDGFTTLSDGDDVE